VTPWVYLALPAGGAAVFLAARRLGRPRALVPSPALAPAVIAAVRLTAQVLREAGHKLTWEYQDPGAVAATCDRCGGRLTVTAGYAGSASVHGNPRLVRGCEPRP
jgi:hypothetical protein